MEQTSSILTTYGTTLTLYWQRDNVWDNTNSLLTTWQRMEQH